MCRTYSTLRLTQLLTDAVLAATADLGLETGLDSVDRPPRTARLARNKEDTVLLREKRVG